MVIVAPTAPDVGVKLVIVGTACGGVTVITVVAFPIMPLTAPDRVRLTELLVVRLQGLTCIRITRRTWPGTKVSVPEPVPESTPPPLQPFDGTDQLTAT